MNYHKAKGTMFERQLKKMLEDRGFFVTRASGSGSDGVSPDLIVLHTTKKFALECKAWRNSLHFDKPKIEIMRQWEQNTGLPFYIAWKMPHKEWRFFPLMVLKETERGFVLSENDLLLGLTFDDLVGSGKVNKL